MLNIRTALRHGLGVRTLGVMKTNAVALLVTALLLMAASEAQADHWTAVDTAVQSTVLVGLAIDYAQTTRIINDPVDPAHRESNPVMGPSGNRIPPEAYFLTVAVAHTVAVSQLPQPYRRLAQGLALGVQAYSVTHNWQAGYTFEW